MLHNPKLLSFPVTLTGRNVAHSHRTTHDRIALVKQLVSGEAVISPLTYGQACKILGISFQTVWLAGRRPESLAEHYARASQAEKLEAACQIGVSKLWDELINPLV
jgi:hypothetical protein